MRNKDLGEVGEALSGLVVELKSLDFDTEEEEKDFFVTYSVLETMMVEDVDENGNLTGYGVAENGVTVLFGLKEESFTFDPHEIKLNGATTTDYDDPFELSITNIINIILIAVGIVLILLGIAIILKK